MISLNETKYLIYAVQFKLLNLFFYGNKSCNCYFHICSDAFLIKCLLCLCLKIKHFWALACSNNFFLKCKIILQSSLLSSLKIFDGSSKFIVFQNLVPQIYVQLLSFVAFINQNLLILKMDASTSILLVCS